MWYAGTGIFSPSSGMKRSSMLANGLTWRTGYNYSFGSVSPFCAGFELRLDYSKFPGRPEAPSAVSSLRYTNGSASPQLVSLQLDVKPKKPDAFQYLIGPALFYSTEEFFLQSSFLFGYASVSQEPFAFFDSIRSASNPADNRNIIFYTAGHETNNGFVFVPGVKAGIELTRHIGFFASLDYSIGPRQHFSDLVLIPQGSPVNGTYTFQQLNAGELSPVERTGHFRVAVVSGNLSIRF